MRVFNETQRITQWFMWLSLAALFALLFYFCYQWYVLGVAVDKVAADDISGQLIVVLCLVPVPLLIFFLKIKTYIDEKGIHYRFIPFHLSQKIILWSDMKICFVREYRPIKEYGGWGYRMSFGNGHAYNIRGNKGIQIELVTGKKILIGTQKEAAAQQVIDRYMKSAEERKPTN